MSDQREDTLAAGWLGAMTSPLRSAGHLCNCIGPQRGEPVCPCRMGGLKQVDGRWVETIDHGPVSRPYEGPDLQEALRQATKTLPAGTYSIDTTGRFTRLHD